MYSIRRRLTLLLALGLAAVIVGAGLWVQALLAARATEEFDDSTLAKARALATMTEQESGEIQFDYNADLMPEFERTERPDYFQFRLDGGKSIERSSRLADDLPLAASRAPEPLVRDVVLPDGRAGRALQLAFAPRGEGEYRLVLVVARGRERLDGLIARMRAAILGGAGVAAVLAALLVWRGLVIGMRPIDEISRQVMRLDAGNLGARVGLARTPRELAPVVEQVNALLDRLEAAFERERRFTGNVAHELRTPIAELRTLAEVAAGAPEDARSVRRFFGDVGEIAGQMERLVGDLLLLARCQAGVERPAEGSVDVREALRAGWERVAPKAALRRVSLGLRLPEGLALRSDPDKLAIILGNLLDNAVSYAPEGSEIRCLADGDAGGVRLEVANPAERLTPSEIAMLTEPFWRKDEARSPGEHVGLGLSLVSALSKLMGLDFETVQDPDGTFRARLGGFLSCSSD